jgi:hypothetical protein
MKRRLEILDDPDPIEKGAPRYTVRIKNNHPYEDDPPEICTNDYLAVMIEALKFRSEGKK